MEGNALKITISKSGNRIFVIYCLGTWRERQNPVDKRQVKIAFFFFFLSRSDRNKSFLRHLNARKPSFPPVVDTTMRCTCTENFYRNSRRLFWFPNLKWNKLFSLESILKWVSFNIKIVKSISLKAKTFIKAACN